MGPFCVGPSFLTLRGLLVLRVGEGDGKGDPVELAGLFLIGEKKDVRLEGFLVGVEGSDLIAGT